MSWLSERLAGLLQERGQGIEVVARQLGIERSRLANIVAGSAIPNENLTKRLAKFFGQDAGEWLDNTQKREQAKPAVDVPPGFFKVAKVADIPDGEMKVVFNDLVAVANSGGRFYAFGNVCPHAAGPIGEGFLEDLVVECPWHAGQWDIATGKALTSLATADIPVFEVRVVDGEIEIKLDQAVLAQGVVSGAAPSS
jgi:nitrite reductase/ring-hydroxylating ferredoxin subunit/plasmid maintenance system antidote protein VapI